MDDNRIRLSNNHLHNLACEHAKVKVCHCGCKGMYHGIKRQVLADSAHGKPIGASMGGELGQAIKELSRKDFQCLGICRKSIKAIGWLGEEHEGGLADKDGKKWWLWISCDNCGYETAWWKIPNRIKALEIEKRQSGV